MNRHRYAPASPSLQPPPRPRTARPLAHSVAGAAAAVENFLPRAARLRRQRRRRCGAWGCEVASANEGGRTGPVASTIGLARPLTYSTNQPPLPHWPGARGRLGHRRPSAVPGAPTGNPNCAPRATPTSSIHQAPPGSQPASEWARGQTRSRIGPGTSFT